jgi:hypothetical protein
MFRESTVRKESRVEKEKAILMTPQLDRTQEAEWEAKRSERALKCESGGG